MLSLRPYSWSRLSSSGAMPRLIVTNWRKMINHLMLETRILRMHSPEQGREKLNDYSNRHYFVIDWRKTVAFVLKILSFVRSRLLLIILGLSCELLYMLYFVRQFPLLKYYHSSTDMGYI